jgi:hypothetical protein
MHHATLILQQSAFQPEEIFMNRPKILSARYSIARALAMALFFSSLGAPAFCQPADGNTAAAKEKPAPARKPLPQTYAEIDEWTRWKFWNKNYDLMEEATATWRQSKDSFADGEWKLDGFYRAVTTLPASAEDKQKWLSIVRDWVQQKPDSITAPVVLASILNKLAWRARGAGYADSVTEESHAAMQKLLAESWTVLEQAKKLPARCPHWWTAAHTVALGQGWSLEKYHKLYEDGLQHNPDYTTLHLNVLQFLLPRWYGQVGDSQKFALHAASQIEGEPGDILYAQLMWRMMMWEPNQDYKGELSSFEKLDRGFVAISKKYPEAGDYGRLWIALCYLSGTEENETARKERARQLLTQMKEIAPEELAEWQKGQAIAQWTFGQ